MEKFLKIDFKKYIFYIVLLMFLVVIGAHFTLIDNDFWARLIQGKAFWQLGEVLKYDFLSYTPVHKWIDHEWGASAIFYFILSNFGDFGLMMFKGGVLFLLFYFMTKTIGLNGVKTTTPYNFLFYFFTYHSMLDITTSTVRCQIITFMFFAIWIYLLELIRKGENRLLILLPIIMLAWCNIHGGCMSGFGLLFIYALGEFLNKKPFKKYLFVAIPCSVAWFINPYGVDYVKFLLMATTMDRPLISEWRPTFDNRDMMECIHFKVYMAVVLLFGSINLIKLKEKWDKIDKTKWLMVIVTLILALRHIKHQPFFVITAACFLYDDFYAIFNFVVRKVRDFLHLSNPTFIKVFVFLKEFLVYGGIAFYCVVAFLNLPFRATVDNNKYPIYAIEFIKTNKIKGNLFISFNHGSYAAYKLYPQNLVVMDGRYEEVYYDDLLPMINKFHMKDVPDWDEVVTKYKTDIIIIGRKYRAYEKLSVDKYWKKIFADEKYAVFLPRSKAQKSYYLPVFDSNYYNDTRWDTQIDWNKL